MKNKLTLVTLIALLVLFSVMNVSSVAMAKPMEAVGRLVTLQDFRNYCNQEYATGAIVWYQGLRWKTAQVYQTQTPRDAYSWRCQVVLAAWPWTGVSGTVGSFGIWMGDLCYHTQGMWYARLESPYTPTSWRCRSN